jgi:hypothetical protein
MRVARVTRATIPVGNYSVVSDFYRARAEMTVSKARDAIRARNAHFECPIRVLHAKQRTKARAAIAFLREQRS